MGAITRENRKSQDKAFTGQEGLELSLQPNSVLQLRSENKTVLIHVSLFDSCVVALFNEVNQGLYVVMHLKEEDFCSIPSMKGAEVIRNFQTWVLKEKLSIKVSFFPCIFLNYDHFVF